MWTLFTISLGLNKAEFSIRGVANYSLGCAKFQGLCNGGVFIEGLDYDEVREELLEAVALNQEEMNGLQ